MQLQVLDIARITMDPEIQARVASAAFQRAPVSDRAPVRRDPGAAVRRRRKAGAVGLPARCVVRCRPAGPGARPRALSSFGPSQRLGGGDQVSSTA